MKHCTLLFLAALALGNKSRELPREALCTSQGFVIYNGLVTDFQVLRPGVYQFRDLTWKKGVMKLNASCYLYVNGTWDEVKRKK